MTNNPIRAGELETTPGEETWRCDYITCIERGGIMSSYGSECKSENFRECPYYPNLSNH
jgi:hypothetical protein